MAAKFRRFALKGDKVPYKVKLVIDLSGGFFYSQLNPNTMTLRKAPHENYSR